MTKRVILILLIGSQSWMVKAQNHKASFTSIHSQMASRIINNPSSNDFHTPPAPVDSPVESDVIVTHVISTAYDLKKTERTTYKNLLQKK